MPDPNLAPTTFLTDAINGVLQVAVKTFGVQYSEGSNRLGPSAFDCSSYVWNAYLQGAGVDIGKDTGAQLTNPDATLVAPSNPGLTNTSGGPPYTYADLAPGDLIYWGNSYADHQSQHVEMFYGANISYGGSPYVNTATQPVVVAEYTTGTVSHPSYLTMNSNGTISGDGVAPVLAVLRFQQAILKQGGVKVSSTFEGVNSPGARGGVDPSSSLLPASSYTSDLSDPRNNLPFSSYFLSQQVNFQGYKGVTPLYSERHMIRGGIFQSVAGGQRVGGQFACYFMMNPANISASYSIDTSQTVLPSSQSAASNSTPAVSSASSSSLSFQLVFNRMYEVWRGDTPGPSDIGCRWDTRALERLIGVYDNIDPSNPMGSHGIALPWPVGTPVQVIFGNQNSVIFNGYISSLSYEYTLFSKDMIPIECYASISVLLMYFQSGKDLINSISHVPSDYYTSTPIFANSIMQVSSSGPLQGFLGVNS